MYKLKSLDKNPSYVKLNIDATSNYQSKTGGLLNLIYILVGIFIFFFKFANVLGGKDVHFTEQIIK
jgi:hypothetical protein